MAWRKLDPIHPGEVLLHEFLEPLGLSQYRLSHDISVPPRRINEIVHGTRAVTADTALRLARYLGTSERFWLNLQARYDLEVQRDQLGDRLQRHVPGMTLASAACAVVLRDSLGFADAAVLTYAFAGRDTVWTTIRVLEPADSGLVRYDLARRSRLPVPDAWSELGARFAEQPATLSYFQHAEFLLDGADSSSAGRYRPRRASLCEEGP